MNRKCTPDDFRFLAEQYAVIPNELNAIADEMEKAGLHEVEVEVTQLFNTYMEKVPPKAQAAAGAVRAKIQTHKQAEIRRAREEGALMSQQFQQGAASLPAGPKKRARKKGE